MGRAAIRNARNERAVAGGSVRGIERDMAGIACCRDPCIIPQFPEMTRPAPQTRQPSRPVASSWLSRPVAPTKAETSLLPPFAGLPPERIYVPKIEAECEAAAEEIFAGGMAGFDTEARPTFQPGEKSTGPHVVQFALADRAFIFQLNRRDCLPVVAGLIASDRVLKVGFGLRNDHSQIRRLLGVNLRAALDLDHVFRKRGYKGQIGVRAAMGALLKLSFPKSKSVTTSNWAAKELTPRQLRYAANDAFAALKIMEALKLKPAETQSHGWRNLIGL